MNADDVVGDVLHETGVDLIAQAAAAPRLEQVGNVAGLQVGLQRGLERLVLHHGDVDLDVRVLGRVGVGHRLPVGLAGIVVLDVPPVDRRPARRSSAAPVAAGARRRSRRCRGVGRGGGVGGRRRPALRRRRRRTRRRRAPGASRASDRSPPSVVVWCLVIGASPSVGVAGWSCRGLVGCKRFQSGSLAKIGACGSDGVSRRWPSGGARARIDELGGQRDVDRVARSLRRGARSASSSVRTAS